MFNNPVFARRGELYEDAVTKLGHSIRPTFDELRTAISAMSFRTYWHDHLHSTQRESFLVVANKEKWEEKMKETATHCLARLPVLCLSVVRGPDGVANRASIGFLGGMGATFSTSVSGDDAYPPLPESVKAWLSSNSVVVLGSGHTQFLEEGGIGVDVVNYIDSDDIFAFFRQSGLITCNKNTTEAPVNLAAQLAFSASYHHAPGTKQDLCDLIGTCNFKGPLPAHRAPGYSVPPGLRISAGDHFVLYYETFGPLYFCLRMIEHGLLFHTVPGVRGHLPLGPLVRNFLTASAVALFGKHRRAPSVELFPHSPKKIEVLTIASNSDRDPAEVPDVFDENPQVPDAETRRTPARAEGPDKEAEPEAMECGEAGEGRSADSPDPNNNTIPAEDDEVLDLADKELEADLGGSPNKSSDKDKSEEPLKQYFTSGFRRQAENKLPDSPETPRKQPRERKDTRREGKKSKPNVRKSPPREAEATKEGRDSSTPRRERHPSTPPPPKTAESPKKRRKLNDGKDDGRQRRGSLPAPRSHGQPGEQRSSSCRRAETPPRQDRRTSGSSRIPKQTKSSSRRSSPDRRGYRRSPPTQQDRARTYKSHNKRRSRSPRPTSPKQGPSGLCQGRRPPPPRPYYSSYRSAPSTFKPLPLDQGAVQTGGVFQEADLRSKLLHNLPFSAAQVKEEATDRARTGARSSAYPKQDGNIKLARQVQGSAVKKGFLAEHRNLPVAETDAAVRNRPVPPLDKTRLDQVHLNHVDRYNNRFTTHPMFESRCEFCGSRHCSKFTAGSMLPNCSRYREHLTLSPTRSICNYRRCSRPTEHHTQVCPSLHQRCPRCLCRGHGPGDGCDLTNGEIMDRLRADFESSADEGAYTRERRLQLSWGWYPYPRGAPVEFAPTSYDDLTEMAVLTALTYLANLLQQAENTGHYPDNAASGDHQGPGDNPPPPPPPPPGPAGIAPVPV